LLIDIAVRHIALVKQAQCSYWQDSHPVLRPRAAVQTNNVRDTTLVRFDDKRVLVCEDNQLIAAGWAMILLRQLYRPPAGAGGRQPSQGKRETIALERNNAQQRHWALRRRSIVVSKSLAMIERRVALFAHLHVNKDAAPEMYRLLIQAGGFLAIT
jgi:hypothetical protein